MDAVAATLGLGAHRLDVRVLKFRTDPARDEPAMLAHELIAEARFQEAVELTSAALERDPTDPDVLLTHGVALARVGRLETAQLALMRAARVAGEWVEPWRQLARVLVERGRPEQALAVAARALSIDPDDAECLRIKREATVVLDARRFLEHGGDDVPALLAQQLLAMGQPALAFEVTQTALLDEHDDPDLLVAHARAAMALGDLVEAASVLDIAVFEAAEWPEVWRLLAEVRERQGDEGGARDAAARGLAITPDDEALRAVLSRLA